MVRHCLAALGLAASLMGGASAQPAETFCQRLAQDLRMDPVPPARSARADAPREWKVNLLGGLGPALFGGTATASFSVAPLGPLTVEEAERLENACAPSRKGMICNLEGPARFTIGTRDGPVSVDALRGERPVVEMRNTSVFCRE